MHDIFEQSQFVPVSARTRLFQAGQSGLPIIFMQRNPMNLETKIFSVFESI